MAMRSDTARYRAAKLAAAERQARRPVFRFSQNIVRGLLPEESDALYAAINAIRERRISRPSG